MSVAVTLAGLTEFIRGLERVPARVGEVGDDVVTRAAQTLAQRVRAAIPTITGELAGSVQWRMDGPLLARVRYGDEGKVDWADAYEKGSPPRVTQGGAGRGRAPKRRVMAKAAPRVRRDMQRKLAAALTDALRAL